MQRQWRQQMRPWHKWQRICKSWWLHILCHFCHGRISCLHCLCIAFSHSVQLFLMLLLHHRKHHSCIVFFLFVFSLLNVARAFMKPWPFCHRFAVLCVALVELREVCLHVCPCLIGRFLFLPLDQVFIREELRSPHYYYFRHNFFFITSSNVAFLQFRCQFVRVLPIVCDALCCVPFC